MAFQLRDDIWLPKPSVVKVVHEGERSLDKIDLNGDFVIGRCISCLSRIVVDITNLEVEVPFGVLLMMCPTCQSSGGDKDKSLS